MLADAPDVKLRKGRSKREMVELLTPAQKALLKIEMARPDAPGDLGELIERVFNLPRM